MAVFRISADDWGSVNDISTLLTYIFNSIDPNSVYINTYLRKYALENIKKVSDNRIAWQSDNYSLNPKYVINAKSRAAIENHGGVSPLGGVTELESYLIPYGQPGKEEVFIVIGSDYIGFIEPNNPRPFMIVGVISPAGVSVPYFYVYASDIYSSPSFDDSLIEYSRGQYIFMCFPADIATFHDKDEHKLFINLISGKHTISMSLITGYTEKGNPIFEPFSYIVRIVNFDSCRLSNDIELYELDKSDGDDISNIQKLIPDDLSFINNQVTGHNRSVNTLNDITNLKSLDIFIRENDSLKFYSFFSHIYHLANCSSYHFTEWFTAKIDYPTTGAKWFLCSVGRCIHYSDSTSDVLNVPYQGIGILTNDEIYFSATDLDKAGGSDILADGSTTKVLFNCQAELPDNVFGVEIDKILNQNCVYNNGVPTGAMIIAAYSPTYTVFYGDENNVFSKLIIKQELVDAASKGGNYTLIDDNGFSLVVSFYNGLWNILVPITYNCVVFDIYKFTANYEGGDFGVVSSIQ